MTNNSWCCRCQKYTESFVGSAIVRQLREKKIMKSAKELLKYGVISSLNSTGLNNKTKRIKWKV